MNLEQIRNSIVVDWKERDGMRIAVVKLGFQKDWSFHREHEAPDKHIEARLKEDFIRELYEDRRDEIWKAVEAVHMANPYNGDLREKLNHLFGLMKHAQPK